MNGVTHDADTVFCIECGIVNEDATTLLRETQETAARQAKDLNIKDSQLKKLRNGERALQLSPDYPKAMRVLVRWQRMCAPQTRELEGKRLEHCLARCKGYDEEELNTAVDGYARFPFIVGRGQRSHVGTPAQWRADAELIFRNATLVDQGIRLAQEQEAQIPHAVLEQIPWKRIRELNRKAIIQFLTDRFGQISDFAGNGFLESPCPVCDDGSKLSTPLRVTPLDAMLAYLVECRVCGLDDRRILTMLGRARSRPREEAIQLEMACV